MTALLLILALEIGIVIGVHLEQARRVREIHQRVRDDRGERPVMRPLPIPARSGAVTRKVRALGRLCDCPDCPPRCEDHLPTCEFSPAGFWAGVRSEP